MLKLLSRNKCYSSLDEYNPKKDKQSLLQFGSNRGFSSLDDSTVGDSTQLSSSSSIKIFKRSKLNVLYTYLRAVIVIRRFLKKAIISRRTSKRKEPKFEKPLSKFDHTNLWEDDNILSRNEEKYDGSFDDDDFVVPSRLRMLLSSDSSYYLEAMQLEVQRDECDAKMVKFKSTRNNSEESYRYNKGLFNEVLPLSSKACTHHTSIFKGCTTSFNDINYRQHLKFEEDKTYIEI